MTLNVLSTPTIIFEELQQRLPSAQCSGAVNQGRFSLTVKLPNIQPVVIDHAVDIELITHLKKLVDRVLVQGKSHQQQDNLPMDISRFSYEDSLLEWARFQRVMYEKSGNTCLKALISYLDGVDDPHTLLQLGLAPAQLTQGYTEDDMKYFETLSRMLKDMPSDQSKRIFENLKQRYPNIYQIVRQLIQTGHTAVKSQGDYQSILNTLKRDVIGQDPASELVATTLASQVNQAGNKVFLFVGPSGVGKTEMAKAASLIKDKRYISFEMNQYQEEHSVSRLFGSPPGYVGSSDKPLFAREVEKFSHTVIGTDGSKKLNEVKNLVVLFDEFEKASSAVKQSLLTLFDEGHCTVQYTSNQTNNSIKYIFKNSIFVGTSNLYREMILETFQQGMKIQEISALFVQRNNLEYSYKADNYSPELLGRLTVIPFGPVSRGSAYQTLLKRKMYPLLVALKMELGCKDILVDNEPQVLVTLESILYGNGTDIRRVKKYFEEDVKNTIYKHKNKWGDLSRIELVLTQHEPNKLSLRIRSEIFGVKEDLDMVTIGT